MSAREGFVISMMALGLLMVGSPWLLGFSRNELAAISACGIGTLLMVPAVAALLERHEIATGSALTLGAWSLLAPIIVGFASELSALTAHLITGLASMLLAVTSQDWRSQGPPEIRV
jgi:hypothetical protein